jgi:hypothetical protein
VHQQSPSWKIGLKSVWFSRKGAKLAKGILKRLMFVWEHESTPIITDFLLAKISVD